MVTVYGNKKEQAMAKALRAFSSVALLAAALTGFTAAADGLFLPDILTGTAQPAGYETESEPVVAQPAAITSGLTAVAPASDAALTYEQETEIANVPVPTWRPATSEPRFQSDLPDDNDGAGTCTTGDCNPSKNNGLAGQIADGKKIAGEVIAKAPVEEPQPRRSNLSIRLSQAAWASAARCRDFANFKERRMGIAKYKTVRNKKGKKVRVQIAVTYNSCKFFGKNNVFKSKGMCAAGVREAFADAGIRIAAADARNLRPNLVRAGFKKVAYEPAKVKAGTVLVCNGGSSGFGHTEVVVENMGERWFCSDFCSRGPTCSKAKGYSNMTAYSLGI